MNAPSGKMEARLRAPISHRRSRPATRAVQAASDMVDAINRRDADALAALCAPGVRFTSAIELRRRTYTGRSAVRGWIEQLVADERAGRRPRTRIELARARTIDRRTVLVAGDISIAGVRVGPFVALVVCQHDLVVSAHAFFSDEQTLGRLGQLPRPSGAP